MSDLTRSIITGIDAILTPEKYILCALVALVCGILITVTHSFKNKSNMSLYGTIAFLPVVVMTIIMVVSQNIGAGVAVAGAFTLIRFRSIPGEARAVGNLFCSTACGILCGMGYLFYAGMFCVIVCLFQTAMFFALKSVFISPMRFLRIVTPENLDYEEAFNEIFGEYLNSFELMRVKTINMGSLFELTYSISPKVKTPPKEFLDKIRARNGNLSIILSRELPELTL